MKVLENIRKMAMMAVMVIAGMLLAGVILTLTGAAAVCISAVNGTSPLIIMSMALTCYIVVMVAAGYVKEVF